MSFCCHVTRLWWPILFWYIFLNWRCLVYCALIWHDLQERLWKTLSGLRGSHCHYFIGRFIISIYHLLVFPNNQGKEFLFINTSMATHNISSYCFRPCSYFHAYQVFIFALVVPMVLLFPITVRESSHSSRYSFRKLR